MINRIITVFQCIVRCVLSSASGKVICLEVLTQTNLFLNLIILCDNLCIWIQTQRNPLDYLFDACYKKIEFLSFQAIQTKELYRGLQNRKGEYARCGCFSPFLQPRAELNVKGLKLLFNLKLSFRISLKNIKENIIVACNDVA